MIQKPEKHYCLGFAFFNPDFVLLMNKSKPAWQAGRLNGVGGKIESTDCGPDGAMAREFKEETGLDIPRERWSPGLFAILQGDGFKMWCFSCRIRVEDLKGFKEFPVVDGESAEWCNLPHEERRLDNLRWLVPMAFGYLERPDTRPVQLRIIEDPTIDDDLAGGEDVLTSFNAYSEFNSDF